MSKTSLLLGASGRIGRMVLRAWRLGGTSERNIAAQYRRDPGDMGQENLIWDIKYGIDPVRRWIRSNGPISTFVVLSGVTPATGSEMSENVSIVNAYLGAAQALGVPRVLLASSSAVYGAGKGKPLSEEDDCRPLNAYGSSKLEMELLARKYYDCGLDICCLRIGNVAGADALLLNAPHAHPHSPLEIDSFADGHGPQRSYIGPASLADVLGQLIDHDARLPFVLNVAAPQPVYMEDLAEAATLPWIPRRPSQDAQQRIVLNCDKLVELVELKKDRGAAEILISEWKEFDK